MIKETVLDLAFAIQFDHTLFVGHEVIGCHKKIVVMSLDARLEFPREPVKNSIALQPPLSAPNGITTYLSEKHWGLKKEGYRENLIEACLIIIPIKANLDFDLTQEQMSGKDVRSILNSVMDWFDSFNRWIWVLTAQSLNPVYPDPKVLHRRSRNVIITGSTSEKTSVPSIEPTELTTYIGDDGQESERIVNKKVFDLAVASAGTPPPLSLELLSSARMAARRRDFRRSLIDAGTASELALSDSLKLGNNHILSLGQLVMKAKKQGLRIPNDTQNSLVALRNDAVHRGRVASCKDVNRALEIAEDLVALVVRNLIPFSSLVPVFRPQRHDMIMIRNS